MELFLLKVIISTQVKSGVTRLVELTLDCPAVVDITTTSLDIS